MAFNDPYAQYAQNRILTASPAELTLMLYEGAIKFCNLAIMGVEQKDIQKAHNNIIKTQMIIEEFQITLNRDYPVARDFDMVYNYLLKRLREANVKKGDYPCLKLKTTAYTTTACAVPCGTKPSLWTKFPARS